MARGRARPEDPHALTDEQWADYLFMRKNSRGLHRELWNHAQGCRRWFEVERDTVSYLVKGSYEIATPSGSQDDKRDAD